MTKGSNCILKLHNVVPIKILANTL